MAPATNQLSLTDALPFLQQLLQAQPAPQPPDPSQAQAPAAQTQQPQQATNQPQQQGSEQVTPQPQTSGAGDLQEAQAVAPQSKGHKLLQILQGGLVGGLSGVANNAETYARTGRNAGFGGGLAGGFGGAQGSQLPFQQQLQQTELAGKQAQTGMLQSEQSPVNIPGYGPMPGWLAKQMGPAWIQAQAKRDVATTNVGGKKDVANIQQQTQENIHRFIPVSGVGLFDAQTKQLMPDTGQGITVTPEIAADHGLPSDFVGKPMKLSDFNSMMRFENQQTTTVQGENGPALVNKKTAKVTPLGLGNPGMGKPIIIGDVNNPGQTVVSTGAQAQGAPGPTSASVEVPRAAAKAEVPTNIGNQKVAFNTAMQHADLLESAVKALNNGDQQTLNALGNRFKTEFGGTGPLTAQTIANAYSHEITTMIAKGHMTDAEVKGSNATLDTNRANPAQIMAAVNAYRSLAQSKMNMLNQQKQNAISGAQPARSTPSKPTSGADPFAQFGGKAR